MQVFKLSLSKKLHLLMAFVTVAFISLSYVGYTYTKRIKTQSDALYFTTLKPMVALDTIESLYMQEIANRLLTNYNRQESILLLLPSISHAISQIELSWQAYIKKFNSKKEQAYITYADNTINGSIKQIRLLQSSCKAGCLMQDINITLINRTTQRIHSTIQTLRQYELEQASINRQQLEKAYQHARIQTLLIMALFILIAIILAIYLFSSIQKVQFSLAVATKRLEKVHDKLEQSSYTDSVTALYNRRYFNNIFQTEFKRAYRAKVPITLLLMEVDYLYAYNKKYGFQAGDILLQRIGEALLASLHRPGDYLFRYSDNELAAVICDADQTTADSVCNILLKAVRSLEIAHATHEHSAIATLSIGAVSYTPLKAMTQEDIVNMADINLKEAIKQGSNQYILTYDFKSVVQEH